MNSIHTFVVLAYKESKYLEECLKSVTSQSIKTQIIIATSTPNQYIYNLAKKYNLDVIVNKNHNGIGGDFNFALQCANTELVTIAHQDDIYEPDYAKYVIDNYMKYPNSIILFSDYYEIRGKEKESKNKNLQVKRMLLKPIIGQNKSDRIRNKRAIIKFGNSICCPSVTFSKKNIKKDILEKLFICNFKCNVDWHAWEILSKESGNFIYINEILMGHRISEESTTSEIIAANIRTKEDLEMLEKFWPKCIAKVINKFYVRSEKSNKLKV